MILTLTWKRDTLDIEISPENTVLDLKARVADAFNVSLTGMKLLVKGKMLANDESPLGTHGFGDRTKVLVMASPAEEIEKMEKFTADPTLRPIDNARFRSAGPSGSRTKEMCFDRIVTIPGLPNEAEAKRYLEEIAQDRGVVAVMKSHGWRVPVLREMYPQGKVGVDPVCVLGLNVNKGQEIQLRIRTDDMKGFVKYYQIRDVMFHELSHNVHSEHDSAFYNFMSQLKKEGDQLDWTKSGGRSVSGSDSLASPSYEDEVDATSSGYRLGGNAIIEHALDPRTAAALAAERRIFTAQNKPANNTTSSPQASGSSPSHSVPPSAPSPTTPSPTTSMTSNSTSASISNSSNLSNLSSTDPNHVCSSCPLIHNSQMLSTQSHPHDNYDAPQCHKQHENENYSNSQPHSQNSNQNLNSSENDTHMSSSQNSNTASNSKNKDVLAYFTVTPNDAIDDDNMDDDDDDYDDDDISPGERVARKVHRSLSKLQRRVSKESYCGTLEALQVYISNPMYATGGAQANTDMDTDDAERQTDFLRINMANSAFQNKVGRYPEALQVLTDVGFEPQPSPGYMVMQKPDSAILRVARTVLEQHMKLI
eukprot:TRINITY_DN925_c0_g1::TRINITY_DN925_c0_g1_i1::g.16040::m.16040 TRINITY_DN925_c0_g1::TRINITY_DN925_c0_g1_i1::g.16040  ORF type:complete len:606 (+),score=68.76,sp/O94580/YQ77_SCHPO/32.14/6e-28,WLM/PF08325.5/6e-42,WLM/PF08325.5/4.3e+03,ubiquitin/PF00240.18/1.4e-08,PUB/PF09409.5/3.9e+03,PUB/PF09409.5/0.00031,DUF45/PF01863.12/0.0039,DUF45/PF01863.12/9.8e+03,FYDLN_acid/PF09538.5/18 TRINITY_DN925_c0_g1_i1:43-1818(+)